MCFLILIDTLKSNQYDFEIYRNLLTDPHLAGAIEQRKMQVMQMDYEIIYDSDERLKRS